jgi:hypothetical protein
MSLSVRGYELFSAPSDKLSFFNLPLRMIIGKIRVSVYSPVSGKVWGEPETYPNRTK